MISHRCMKPGFVRDSAVLIAGAAVSQLAIITATPIITRLYTQADLGMLGAFVGFTSLFGQLSCLRYEQAIMIAKEHEVFTLVRLSLALNTAVAALAVLLVWIGGEALLTCCGFPSLLRWMWLIPITSFGLGLFQLLQVLLSRQRRFTIQSQSRIAKSGVEVVAQIAAAVSLGASAVGLIFGYTLGVVVQALWMAAGAAFTLNVTSPQAPDSPATRDLARRYAAFPMFAVPHGLAATFNNLGFTLVIAALIGPQVAGLFYLTHRLLAAPTALISQALSPLFYQRLCSKRERPDEAQMLIAAAFVGLLAIGAVPLLSIAAAGPWLFGECFGPEWADSGRLVRAVWPAYLMAFCTLPITQAFYVYEKQAAGLCWQISSAVVRVVAVCVAYQFGGQESALIAFGLVGAMAYGVVVVMALRWAGCRPAELPKAMLKAFGTIASYLVQKEAAPA